MLRAAEQLASITVTALRNRILSKFRHRNRERETQREGGKKQVLFMIDDKGLVVWNNSNGERTVVYTGFTKGKGNLIPNIIPHKIT